MALKLVISDPKSGLSVQKETTDDASKGFMGLKLGDTVKGELVDLHGYEFVLTGGSDYCGFPMRKDVAGVGRKKILAYQGVGIKKAKKGIIQRKTVCGNTVHTKISQLNLKVLKQGTVNIFSEAGKKKEGKEAGKEDKEVTEQKKELKTEKPDVKIEKMETVKEQKKQEKPEQKQTPAAKSDEKVKDPKSEKVVKVESKTNVSNDATVKSDGS